MSNKPNRNKLKSDAKIYWPTVILISGLVVLLIPIITMGLIFFDAFEGTGNANDGNRFSSELQNELTNEQIEQIETTLKEIESTLKIDVNLKSATLRVSVLVNDDMTQENMITFTESAMDKIYGIAAKELYFMNNVSYKQYDLEVHVFNDRFALEDENYLYVLGSLNATMETQMIQVVSNPLDPEFVAELYQSILDEENEEDNPEVTPEENPDAIPEEGTGDAEGE
jgi:hypothetical protein